MEEKISDGTGKAEDAEKTQFGILIAEDDAVSALMMRKLLIKEGYRVVEIVARGERVLESVKRNMPDLIIMDIILDGEVDGIMAAEQVKREFPIPIIFSTGNADRETVKRAEQISPEAMIIKPIRKELLLKKIKEIQAREDA